MNDISTIALFTEMLHRMEHHIYGEEEISDDMLTSIPIEDTMGMYFAIEEYLLCYKELIEERRHMQG